MAILLSSLVPTSGVNALYVIYKTTNHTALPGQRVLVGTDTGAITITLPANPTAGTAVAVWDADNNAGANNITIDRNGQTIDGAAANDTLDVSGGHFEYVFDGTTWKRAFWAPGGVQESNVIPIVQTAQPHLLPRVYQIANLADDSVAVLTFDQNVFAGQFLISTNNNVSYPAHGVVAFRCATSVCYAYKIAGDALLEVATGALTGTTGTDTKLTVSPHTDLKLYVENRLGAPITFCLTVFGASLATPVAA